MFNFLKRLLGRDSAPSEAVQASTTSVDSQEQTSPAESTLPIFDLKPETRARADAASTWCIDRNIELAASVGLGQEERWSFSQETATLTLVFQDGTEHHVAGQILASFDPADKSFMWAWDNPSLQDAVTKDAHLAKALGESLDEPALTTGKQRATFDHATALVVLAAQHAGAGGVCRLRTNGWSTVFVALHPDHPTATSAQDAAVAEAHIAVVKHYEAPLFQADVAYNESGMDPGLQDELFARKRESYQRHWVRDDDYHEPCSLGWPSDCDPASVRTRFVVPARSGGMIVATLGETGIVSAYQIRAHGSDLKIVDNLIDFDSLFLWPTHEASP